MTLAKPHHLFESQALYLYILGGSIHSVNKYLLSAYYMPGTVLGSGDTTVTNRDKNACPCGDDVLGDNVHSFFI